MKTRAKRAWPGLDDKRILSWNALVLLRRCRGGARAHRLPGCGAGLRGFVYERDRDAGGRLLRTFNDEAKLNAYLEDHAYLVEALLTLYQSTFEVRWFDAARETADA